jgi:hypothetical protein
MNESIDIENANLVIDHFGYWPSFHDAEIMSMHFSRNMEKTLGSLQMRIYAFEMTNKVVGRYYKLIKHRLLISNLLVWVKTKLVGLIIKMPY